MSNFRATVLLGDADIYPIEWNGWQQKWEISRRLKHISAQTREKQLKSLLRRCKEMGIKVEVEYTANEAGEPVAIVREVGR
jgi:hypothetical protein